MGPADPVRAHAGKLFVACYALYSAVASLATIAIVMAPLAHRRLHQFHDESGTE
jgi:hypothetical protein